MQFVSKLPAKPVKQSSACSVTFAEFARNSEPAPACEIAGKPVPLASREFSSGSFGWMLKGRPTVLVKLANGSIVECTLDVKLYVKNSKLAMRLGDDTSVLNPSYLAKLESGAEADDEAVDARDAAVDAREKLDAADIG